MDSIIELEITRYVKQLKREYEFRQIVKRIILKLKKIKRFIFFLEKS